MGALFHLGDPPARQELRLWWRQLMVCIPGSYQGADNQLSPPKTKFLPSRRGPEAAGCGSRRKMVFWGGVRPPPRTLSASPEGGGGMPCSVPRECFREARKSLFVMQFCDVLAHTACCRVNGGHVGWGVSKPVHGSVHPYGWADVCGMQACASAQFAMCC